MDFPGVFVFDLGISKGFNTILWNIQGLSFALSGISWGKVKKKRKNPWWSGGGGWGFEKVYLQPLLPVWIFSGIVHWEVCLSKETISATLHHSFTYLWCVKCYSTPVTHIYSKMSLEYLTKNLAAWICILSGERSQTMSLLGTNYMLIDHRWIPLYLLHNISFKNDKAWFPPAYKNIPENKNNLCYLKFPPPCLDFFWNSPLRGRFKQRDHLCHVTPQFHILMMC